MFSPILNLRILYLVQLIEHPILPIPNFTFPNLRCCKVFFSLHTLQAIPFCSWYEILSFLSSQRTLTNALHHSFSWILCQVDFRVIFKIVQAALLVNCDGSICTFNWVHDMFSRIFRIHTNLQTLSPIFFSWKRKQMSYVVQKAFSFVLSWKNQNKYVLSNIGEEMIYPLHQLKPNT